MSADYNKKDKIFDIMNRTQSNYSNMLKRLESKKIFSNFTITYYSIGLITFSLTAEFYPDKFDVKLSSYFNIILSIVMLTYSLIISSARYSERIQSAQAVLNKIKTKKRELTDDNVKEKREEYEAIMDNAEYRSEIDFFRTIKQRCREKGVRWYRYKYDLNKKDLKIDDEESERLNNYLSENFPLTQQMKIILLYLWDAVILMTPFFLFVLCIIYKN